MGLQERKECAELDGKCCGSREFAGGELGLPGSVGSRECHSLPACEPSALQERASLPSPAQLKEFEITLGC